jgi:tryptophan synthase beta subunit
VGQIEYGGPNAVGNAIGYAMHYSRSHDAVIHVYDEAGNVIETHEHAGTMTIARAAISGVWCGFWRGSFWLPRVRSG